MAKGKDEVRNVPMFAFVQLDYTVNMKPWGENGCTRFIMCVYVLHLTSIKHRVVAGHANHSSTAVLGHVVSAECSVVARSVMPHSSSLITYSNNSSGGAAEGTTASWCTAVVSPSLISHLPSNRPPILLGNRRCGEFLLLECGVCWFSRRLIGRIRIVTVFFGVAVGVLHYELLCVHSVDYTCTHIYIPLLGESVLL